MAADNALAVHLERGRKLRLENRLEEALGHFEEALRVDAGSARAHAGYGATLARLGESARAVEAYWEALRIQPLQPRIYGALATMYLAEGRVEPAVDCFRQALAQRPDDEILRSNLLYALNFDNRASPEEVFGEHCEFGRRLNGLAGPPAQWRRKRVLKIGYVSADFRDHAVSYNFWPVLENHRRSTFEITLYSSTQEPDFLTRRLRRLACRWRDVRKASDEDLAGMVRRDGIDILVDLAGHTSIARMGTFARKPAPVQVNFQGYPNTSGLTTMDYRITDEWADPHGATERWHTERLVRLPGGFLCFRPEGSAPAVAKTPCLGGKTITFGSCSKPAKWNGAVIGTWAAILRQVPDSRLLLHHSTTGSAQTRVLEAFFSHGIAPNRIGISGALDWKAHWEWFHQVDVALDPFPYNGTAGSCETLWMGVPFIALAGRTHVARVGVSLLTRIGLERLVARDEGEYVALAVQMCGDREALAGLRSGMRRRLRSSTLLDGRAFTRGLEEAYRQMWNDAGTPQRHFRSTVE
jgi:predicted O-linked N-acetylglucosamine transferase (SPINDLY family)